MRPTPTLSTDRVAYYVGERMRLSLTFRNVSDQNVRGYFDTRPGLGPTNVLYRVGAGEFTVLNCFPTPPGHVGPNERTLGTNQEMTQYVDLSLMTLGPPTLLFDRLTRFEFYAVFVDAPGDPNSRLESNVVSVDVVEAPAEERAAQADYTPWLAYLAQVSYDTGVYMTREIMAEATTFIERHPRSRYVGPVRAGLLMWLQSRYQTSRATDQELALREKLLRQIDATPPELYAEASPKRLWPPNHKLVQVLTTVSVTDAEDPNPTVKLPSITCEDDCKPAEDIVGADLGTDDREFELRAERRGSARGRTYTITYSATDATGNESRAVATVVVPHDQGKK
jgi:hypothetical protein